LEASGVEAVDVLADGDNDFARQVAAFLATVQLVFEVDACGTVLCEELCQFQYGAQTAMAGVTIRDYGSEVVHVRC
jgi:hypothetical protein